MKTPDAILGVMLKGVDGGYDWSFFRDHLLEGELPRVGDSIRTKEILISRSVAREMGLVPGDKVEMLFVESEKSPRRDRFKVSGIYATGMDEFDRSVAMTDLRNVQRLADWSSDEVSGYEVTLADFSQAEDFSRRLNDMLLDSDREAFLGPDGPQCAGAVPDRVRLAQDARCQCCGDPGHHGRRGRVQHGDRVADARAGAYTYDRSVEDDGNEQCVAAPDFFSTGP